MWLKITDIRTDGGTQPRVAMDPDTVAYYADAMREGVRFPPVVVFYDGTSYWLADGFHRRDAAFAAGFQEIDCEVHRGTQQDAQWYSYSANKGNGLRRSNDDKARAVKAALMHPNAAGKGNREIARHVGVDESTVRGWREKLSAEIPQMEVRTVTRGGSTYEQNTANIGRHKPEPAAHLLAAEEATEALTDEDAVPEVPEAPISVTGDLWWLGPHVLLVGDATNAKDVARLMDGAAADLVFTDPPYNVDYEGYTKDRLTIQGDRMTDEQFCKFLATTFANYRRIVKPGASLYVCHPSSWQREFQNALEAAGFEVRCQIIWVKNTFAWGFGRYKFQHEPIFYCHVAGQTDAWYGDKSQSTLWQENKPAANRLHPTMKPVELVERALVNSSKAGDIVVDLFGGSGSTLIACERRGRAARLMELDARYADVICRRYQEYTGNQAVLDGGGRSFDEIANERRKEAA